MDWFDFITYFQVLLTLISRETLGQYCSIMEQRRWISTLEIGLPNSFARRFPTQASRRFLKTCLLLPEDLMGLGQLEQELESLLWERKIRLVNQRIFSEICFGYVCKDLQFTGTQSKPAFSNHHVIIIPIYKRTMSQPLLFLLKQL